MYLLQQLYDTYNQNISAVGKVTKTVTKKGSEYVHTLLPVGHRTKNTTVQIDLTPAGELVDITCGIKQIIIPVTIDSGGRSSNVIAHPLHDDLKFIASDNWRLLYPGEQPPTEGKDQEKYAAFVEAREQYLTFLERWANYSPASAKLKAVHTYMEKGTLVQDFIDFGLFEVEKDNSIVATTNATITNGIKLGGKPDELAKNTIRFNIVDTSPDAPPPVPLWEDIALMHSYEDFYENIILAESESVQENLCFITGEVVKVTPSAPKFIRSSGDGAKLISLNDSYFDGGFFRRDKTGRNKGYVASVGYVASEKAFAALKWLIERQGYQFSPEHILLAWGNDADTSAYNVALGVEDLLQPPRFNETLNLEDSADLLNFLNEVEVLEKETANPEPFTFESYAKALTKAIRGYAKPKDLATLNNPERQITIARFDSFNPGRFYVRDFVPMSESVYIDRLLKWQERGMWKHHYYSVADNRRASYYGVPSIKNIIKYIVSPYKADKDNKEITRYSAELLDTILNDTPVPEHIIRNLDAQLRNYGNLKYTKEDPTNRKWNDLLATTCSLLKNKYGREGEHYTMTLNKENTNRDYLFGRWLATAHLLEEAALKSSGADIRETNAMRLLAAYQQRPMTTLGMISNRLAPYKQKLASRNKGLAIYYENLLDEILATFDEADFTDKQLTPRMHLGFSNQRTYIFTKKNVEVKPVDENENDVQADETPDA